MRAVNFSGSAQVVDELQGHDKTNEKPHVSGDQVAKDDGLSFISGETPIFLASSSIHSRSPQDFILPEVTSDQQKSSYGVSLID